MEISPFFEISSLVFFSIFELIFLLLRVYLLAFDELWITVVDLRLDSSIQPRTDLFNFPKISKICCFSLHEKIAKNFEIFSKTTGSEALGRGQLLTSPISESNVPPDFQDNMNFNVFSNFENS